MKELLCALLEHQRQGRSTVMVSVTASSGSVPRGAGARMLVGSGGRICGTIGGGAVEYEAERFAVNCLEQKCSGIRPFCLAPNKTADIGMVCGGDVNVCFQFIDPEDREAKEAALSALDCLNANCRCWMVTVRNSLKGIRWLTVCEEQKLKELLAELLPDIGECERARCLDRRFLGFTGKDQSVYVERLCDGSRVYIFGAGHVARELVPLLTHLGFACVVTDDRESFADPAYFPAEAQVLKVDFEKLSDTVQVRDGDYAVIMTRGHQYDTRVQAHLLRTNAAYIGVMGSRKKKAAVREALKKEGFTDADLDRIKTPGGLAIRAETPEEIAVSIAAELIMVRRDNADSLVYQPLAGESGGDQR